MSESGSAKASGPSSTRLGVAPSYALDERLLTQIGLGAAGLTFVGGIVAGVVFGPATTVLIFASGAFVAVIALFWSSLRTLLGETSLSSADAYAMGAPRDEEEQKRAVLRALKDLEFERSVGKISEEDYRQLVFHYRTEAKRLLRLIDERSEPLRRHAEDLISKRLRAEGLVDPIGDPFRSPALTASEKAVDEHREQTAQASDPALADSQLAPDIAPAGSDAAKPDTRTWVSGEAEAAVGSDADEEVADDATDEKRERSTGSSDG